MRNLRVYLIGILSFYVHFLFAQLQNPASVNQESLLQGTVVDASTQLPLVGASIYITDLKVGAVTDVKGFFKLIKIPSGSHTVEISFVGYSTMSLTLDVNGHLQRAFQLTPSILEQHEVIVTGVSAATLLKRMVTPVTVLKAQDLERSPASNLVDLLAHKPGISLISTGPSIAKPVIRGLGFNRVVVLQDGIKQEGQQWGEEHGLEVDDHNIQRIEILKGPASLVYGSDAMAGVIQIFNNTPVPQGTMKGSWQTDYQTNHRYRASSFQIGASHLNGINWKVYGSGKAAGDYKNAYDGYVFNSKFREWNGGGYLGMNGTWGYTHLMVNSFSQNTGIVEGERNSEGAFTMPAAGGMTTIPSDDDFHSTLPKVPWQSIRHFKLGSDNNFNIGKGSLSILAAYQRNLRGEFGDPEYPNEKSLFFDLTTLQLSTAYRIRLASGWNITSGLQSIRQQNRNRASEVLIPAYHFWDLGSYVFAQRTINKWHFSGGIRADIRSLNAEQYALQNVIRFQEFHKKFSNITGSVGLNYALTDHVSMKLNFSRGFRAPSIAELASNGAHEGTYRYEYGNTALRSETSFQGDAALELNFDHLSFGANLFMNRVNDFIFYQKLLATSGLDSVVMVGTESLTAFQFNQRDAILSGGEFTLDVHPHPLDWLHFENAYSWVHANFIQALEGSRYVPFIPSARLVSDLRADIRKKGKWMRSAYVQLELDRTMSQHRFFAPYNTETFTPGYTLWNASCGFDIVRNDKTMMKFVLHCQNLSDVAYQHHLSRLKYTMENSSTGRIGVFNMGRNFSFKVILPFSQKLP